MSIIKPYTFVAGNKARANEVNEDFDVLYQQVNTNITNIANAESDIENLDTTKANINGSSAQRFAVADPVSSGDAVNKRTLIKQIGNSIDYIGGLTISKDSGSPDDTILIDPGAAYDSTKTVVLALDVITSKQNTTQAANATYYVYIIGNSTGSTTDIIISTEASVPTLPAGYTLYRKIGSYTTNSSNAINSINYYGNDTESNNSSYGLYNDVSNMLSVDWSHRVSKSANAYHTAYTMGFLRMLAGNANDFTVWINGDEVGRNICTAGSYSGNIFYPVGKGDTYYVGGTAGAIQFIPVKGV